MPPPRFWPLNHKWPASPQDKYRDVFPAEHVFKHAKMIRGKLRTNTLEHYEAVLRV